MKVYIVCLEDFEDTFIMDVYTNKSTAEEACERLIDRWGQCYEVSCWTVNES